MSVNPDNVSSAATDYTAVPPTRLSDYELPVFPTEYPPAEEITPEVMDLYNHFTNWNADPNIACAHLAYKWYYCHRNYVLWQESLAEIGELKKQMGQGQGFVQQLQKQLMSLKLECKRLQKKCIKQGRDYNNLQTQFATLNSVRPDQPPAQPTRLIDFSVMPSMAEIDRELRKEDYTLEKFTVASRENITKVEATLLAIQNNINNKKTKVIAAVQAYWAKRIEFDAVQAILVQMQNRYQSVKHNKIVAKRNQEIEARTFKRQKKARDLTLQLQQNQQEQLLLGSSPTSEQLRLSAPWKLDEAEEVDAQTMEYESHVADRACEEEEIQTSSILLGDDDTDTDTVNSFDDI